MADFYSKSLVLWKEGTAGALPSPVAKGYSFKALAFSLAETQSKETNPLLGNGGYAPSTDHGVSSFAGNIETKFSAALAPILVNHTIGTYTSVADFSADAWASTTAYLAGHVVNVSTTHSLVCKVAGTSGATVPTLTGLADGSTVTDGTVVWYVRVGKLQLYTGAFGSCLQTLGIQSKIETGCGTPETFTERYGGVFFNSLELSKADGGIIFKANTPVVAMNRIDSANASYADATITTTVDLADRAFGFDDFSVTFGGSSLAQTRSFKLTVNRNTTLANSINPGEKIANTPIPTMSGDLEVKFTNAAYAEFYANPSKQVVVTMANNLGDLVEITFPTVEMMRPTPKLATNEPVYMTVPLNATGNVTYRVVSTTAY